MTNGYKIREREWYIQGYKDYGINVQSINVLLLMQIYQLLWYTWFFKKYSIKGFFVFDLLWSNRSRFRLCCTSSFYICVNFYLTQFLPHMNIFTVHMLGTKTISKIILLFVFKITESLKDYLHYKTMTSQNVSSETQINNFFISQKNYVPFSRYSSFVFLTIP